MQDTVNGYSNQATYQVILWVDNQENLYNMTKWATTIAMLEVIIRQAVKERTVLDTIDLEAVAWGEVWEHVKG